MDRQLTQASGGCKSVLDIYHPRMARFALLLFASMAVALAGADKKAAEISIRLHAEGNPKEGETFVTPVMLLNPPKRTVVRKVPIITERDVDAFYPFTAADGTIGAYLRLDADGTNKLMQHTVEFRDTLVVAMINGRVAAAMMVNQKVSDGVLLIPSGFAPKEIAQMQVKYPTIGKEKEFGTQKKKAEAALKEAAKNEPKPTPKPKKEQ